MIKLHYIQSFGRTHTATTTCADVAATRKETVTTTSTQSVAMKSNCPAYGTLMGKGIVRTAPTITMHSNPAYEVNTTQLQSESLV